MTIFNRKPFLFLALALAIQISVLLYFLLCCQYMLFFLVLGTSLLTMALLQLFLKAYNRQLHELIGYLNQINHNPHCTLELTENFEGAVSILKNEIYRTSVSLREQTERLSQEKHRLSDAISDISHQLKTPLTSLTLISDLLSSEGLLEEKRRKLLGKQKTILHKLDWLISSLLSIAKFDSGQIELKNQSINLLELINQALQPFEITIELKELSVFINCIESTTIFGDKHWLCEALQNILKNCIEYSNPQGRLYITASVSPLFVSLIIQDEGPGISPAQLPYIFDRFYKGQNSLVGGVGIGLAFAKMIINKSNGTITAKNSQQCNHRVDSLNDKFVLRFPPTTPRESKESKIHTCSCTPDNPTGAIFEIKFYN